MILQLLERVLKFRYPVKIVYFQGMVVVNIRDAQLLNLNQRLKKQSWVAK